MKKGIGDAFHEGTKYQRGRLGGGGLDWERKPAPYKSYPDSPLIELPTPGTGSGMPLWEAIDRRRSRRRFRNETLSPEHLSRLLWAAQGITAQNRGGLFRSAPSAGALYPVETYVVVHDVDTIDSGVYHYAVRTHALEQIQTGDFRDAAARGALDQPMAASGNIVFIWTAIFERAKWKYRQRAYRYIYLDAGHIAENLALAAVSLNLGSCQIAALYDEEVNSLLGIDGENESTLYMSVVGCPL